VLLHGLIHILGLIKAFQLSDVKGITQAIPKMMGLVWLLAMLCFFTYAVLYFQNAKHAWLIGFIAVGVSQCLIVLYWHDAKAGTIPNLIILAVSHSGMGYQNFQNLIRRETEHLLASNVRMDDDTISDGDISKLPAPVKNWLTQSGVLNRPRISVAKLTQIAELQMQPTQKSWLTAEATQYTTIDRPAFIWTVDVAMNNALHFLGRDKLENGKAQMLIKANSLFNLVNEKGEKLNEAAMQRYLGEMVWAPSLALSPFITWEAVNDTTAKATIIYRGTKGTGVFTFNASGDVIKFSAMRFKGNDAEAKRYEWTIQVLEYSVFDGVRVPSRVTSTWKLDDGDWTWLKLMVTDIKYNEQALNTLSLH